jgi:hypothetical protein
MARPRRTGSTIPFGNLGLTPEEERKLQKKLLEKDLSLRQLQRYLIRKWIES